MTGALPETGHPGRLAVVLGLTPPSGGLARPGLDEFRHLPHVESHAAALAAVLRDGYHYELIGPAGQQPTTAAAAKRRVDCALRKAQNTSVVLVHLLGHSEWEEGRFNVPGHFYMIGPDRRRVATAVDDWLVRAQTEGSEVRQALFIVDCCYSGRLVDVIDDTSLRGGSRRAWVVAACQPDQEAYDGRLTAALTEILTAFAEEREIVDKTMPYINVGRVIQLVERHVDQAVAVAQAAGQHSPQKIHRTWVPFGADISHLEFFRNPRYEAPVSGWPLADVDQPMLQMMEQTVDIAHFQGLASGSRGPVPGVRFAFRGRRAELKRLSAWAGGRGPALEVITGKPGVGKSALIGIVVCATLSTVRELVRKDLDYLGVLPPGIPDLAVVHARRRVLADVVNAVAYQWKLGGAERREPWVVEEIIEAIQHRPQPPTLIIDALDEAQNPEDLLAAFILPVATAVRPGDGGPACRLLVGVRPEPRFEPLLTRARVGGGYLDLGAVPPRRLRADLEDYVRKLLRSREGWPDHANSLSDTFAEEVARTLTVAGRSSATPLACGEFLIAGLYVRYVLQQTHLPGTVTAVKDFVANLPRDISGILDLELAWASGKPWTRSVAAALAFAQGTGMPERVVQLAAGAFPPPAREPVSSTRDAPDDGPPIEDVRQALEDLRGYIRRDVDIDGTTLYRLYHERLAEALRVGPYGSAAATAGGAR